MLRTHPPPPFRPPVVDRSGATRRLPTFLACPQTASPAPPVPHTHTRSSITTLSRALSRISLPLELHPKGRVPCFLIVSTRHHPAPCVHLVATDRAENVLTWGSADCRAGPGGALLGWGLGPSLGRGAASCAGRCVLTQAAVQARGSDVPLSAWMLEGARSQVADEPFLTALLSKPGRTKYRGGKGPSLLQMEAE